MDELLKAAIDNVSEMMKDDSHNLSVIEKQAITIILDHCKESIK